MNHGETRKQALSWSPAEGSRWRYLEGQPHNGALVNYRSTTLEAVIDASCHMDILGRLRLIADFRS